MTAINITFWKYSKIVKPVNFYKGKVIELGREIKHCRDKYICKVLSPYNYKECSLWHL